jgi:hypothetical protein
MTSLAEIVPYYGPEAGEKLVKVRAGLVLHGRSFTS